jgi:subtilisin family serine protease
MILNQRFLALIILASLLSTTSLSLNQSVDAQSGVTYKADEVIIKFRQGISEDTKQKFYKKMNAMRAHKFKLAGAEVVKFNKSQPIESWVRKFKADPAIKYAEPNYKLNAAGGSGSLLPNDEFFSHQWGLFNNGLNRCTGLPQGVSDADIDAPEAWASSYTPTGTVVMAVIDTGVEYTHTDLVENAWVNPGEDVDRDGRIGRRDTNNRDDDGNGLVDDFYGWDWVNNDNAPLDDNSHGTMVAGIAAAKVNNRKGVAGVAGQGKVKFMTLKFMGADGSGYTSDAIKAIEYATSKRALIANNSWGGYAYSQALLEAIQGYQATGGLFIAAAGNSGTNNDLYPMYPASYELPNIISVGAMMDDDTLALFSNYGNTTVHLAAPGVSIRSTARRNMYFDDSGTSMAAPFVAGVAGLVWTQNPGFTAAQVRERLLSTARKVQAMEGKTITGGIVNAQSALSPGSLSTTP